MWDLENESLYFRLVDETIPHAFTWGAKNREKREAIRKAIVSELPTDFPRARWWAFRLYAKKTSIQAFDVENIPKLIVDAFAGTQIRRDDSSYPEAELYPDDTIHNVAMVQVAGEVSRRGDSTRIKIFGRRL